jgi:hypothetical protein
MSKAKRYNQDKPDWTLLDYHALEEVVKVMTFGKEKYGKDNWKGELDDINQHIESAFRHLVAMKEGEKYDEESGELHAAHLIANMMMYIHHLLKQETKEVNKEVNMLLNLLTGVKPKFDAGAFGQFNSNSTYGKLSSED